MLATIYVSDLDEAKMADSKVLSADELGKIIDFQWLWANRILRLDDYDSISIEALELLELWEGDLAFDGLQQIQSPAIAECLVACTADHLWLDGLKSIDESTLRELVGRELTLSLNGLHAISREQAEIVAQHPGAVYLDGLWDISAEIAEALAAHQGPWLSLNGLWRVTDPTAAALANYAGGLSLDGLEMISDSPDQQRLLAKLASRPDDLCLDSLGDLSEKSAKVVAGHSGYRLSLNGLRSLTFGMAASLADHGGRCLELHRLEDAFLEAQYQGDVHFESLVNERRLDLSVAQTMINEGEPAKEHWFIDLDAAELLSNNCSFLTLYYIHSLRTHAARVLAKRREYWQPPTSSEHSWHNEDVHLGFEYLASVNDATAKELAKFPCSLEMQLVTRIANSPGHLALVKRLLDNRKSFAWDERGSMAFYLDDLDPAVAREMARAPVGLDLYHVDHISLAAARELSRHVGELALGFRGLSEPMAEALSHHAGVLRLPALECITEQAAKRLSQLRGQLEVSPETFAQSPENSIKILNETATEVGDNQYGLRRFVFGE